jgi:2-keto-3-deoxy-6-phosphogluconate aldolase
MQTINITAYTEDASQVEAIKAVMKALKIKFEISKGKTYHLEFIEKIEHSRQDLMDGKGTVVSMEQLNDLWK